MNDRKQQVLLIAQRLFIENGFLTTTIQDILNKAQISKGTFYNYFSSKNECLIAILKLRDEEIFVRRQELCIGKKLSDKDILAKQILIRFEVNREQNLLPIFQAIIHSEDDELRTFINRHHFKEIDWLANRFTDIYGDKAKKASFDGAVLLLGMIQQLFYVLKTSSNTKINTSDIIRFTMRRMDAIINDMIDTNDTLFQVDHLTNIYESRTKPAYTREQLHAQLLDFQAVTKDELTSDGKEHIQFIIDEIHADKPRIFVLQSVLRSFRESFGDTVHTRDVQEISERTWRYIKTLE